MSDKIFKSYKYDISLREGIGAHLVTWVTALMVFFMTLMLAANVGLNAVADSWMTGLSGSLTVEIRPPMPQAGSEVTDAQRKAFEDKAAKIMWLAEQHPSVSEGRPLTREEIGTLIEPWLGKEMAGNIDLPALIDLKLAPGADLEKLQADIRELVPDATIDTHADTLDDVKTLVSTVRAFVLLLTGVITLLAIVAISGIVSSKFSIHKSEAEILHLLGAPDEYIAKQFRRHTLQGTLKGAVLGVACMTFTLLVIGHIAGRINSAILPHLDIGLEGWALLALTPVVVGTIIAHLTAQVTVMRSLAKLP